ncbi:LCP family protein [Dactylosporangium sp. CA-052675]|uniref:LCP family protein n=1 Tax=Dactylosporangium sp. CA-052675 TaxID=3239927 RepID=UPI003D8EBF77
MPTQERHSDDDPTEVIERIPAPRRSPDPGTAEPANAVPSHAAPKKRLGRKARTTLFILSALAVLIVATVGGTALWLESVASGVKRVDAFDGVPAADRPQKAEAAKDAMNFLLLGSDSRNPDTPDGSRSDTIIVLHIDKAHAKAQLVSIPRDTWVYVPKAPGSQHGNTEAKINAAFAWGGVPGVVQTVEKFTNLRIDHVVMVDFSGFKEIVDALGGVDINVSESFTSTHSLDPSGTRHFEKGLQTMDGATALDYARERYAFQDGDFARIRHQQQVIKAVLNKAASGGTLSSPGKLNDFLRATADAATVDDTLNMFDMAMELRNIRGDDVTAYTSPTKGTGMIGDESVVLADTEKVKPFYDALREDRPLPA